MWLHVLYIIYIAANQQLVCVYARARALILALAHQLSVCNNEYQQQQQQQKKNVYISRDIVIISRVSVYVSVCICHLLRLKNQLTTSQLTNERTNEQMNERSNGPTCVCVRTHMWMVVSMRVCVCTLYT